MINRAAKEWESIDRKRMAYHEAAHAVVGVALGLQEATATLFSVEAKEDNAAVVGGTMGAPIFCLNGPSRCATAYAGCVAESILGQSDIEAYEIDEYIDGDPDFLSPSDRFHIESIGQSSRSKALSESLRLVKDRWQVIEKIAHFLIEEQQRNGTATYTVTEMTFQALGG